jgi:hypothetical protein
VGTLIGSEQSWEVLSLPESGRNSFEALPCMRGLYSVLLGLKHDGEATRVWGEGYRVLSGRDPFQVEENKAEQKVVHNCIRCPRYVVALLP